MQKGKSKSVSQYKESVRTIQTILPLKVNLQMLNRRFLNLLQIAFCLDKIHKCKSQKWNKSSHTKSSLIFNSKIYRINSWYQLWHMLCRLFFSKQHLLKLMVCNVHHGIQGKETVRFISLFVINRSVFSCFTFWKIQVIHQLTVHPKLPIFRVVLHPLHLLIPVAQFYFLRKMSFLLILIRSYI